MKKPLFTFFSFLCFLALSAQIQLPGYKQSQINPQLLTGERWKACWVSLPGEPANVYGVYHFRKSIELAEIPVSFLVHVSADNRYKLYVNGRLVSLGPTLGDPYNWNFETVDLAPFLKKGKNQLAAVVWNFAEYRPITQMSFLQTGFLLQGNTAAESAVNTDASWKCSKNKAYAPWSKSVYGYYAAGAGEEMNASLYPWGWEDEGYDDSAWSNARAGLQAAVKGSMDYPGRLLVPAPIPAMEKFEDRFHSVREAEQVQVPKDFLHKPTSLLIPAHTTATLLLDHQTLTTGYLSLLFSKGKDAEIRIGYAEGLYLNEEEAKAQGLGDHAKGNRDEVKGKRFVGYEDRILADGGSGRSFTTLWWRTWRYVKLTVQTAGEPLQLEDIYGTYSSYPFVNETTFKAEGHPELNRMLEVGWRTARLCAHETYMDCPYYEQLQYFGDTRIQAMVSLFNTRDSFLVKNALEQGRQSISMDGITMSRYPSGLHQFISSFSLWWICMGYDYWMYRGDEAYLKSLLPAYRGVLAWYEQWLKPDNSLGYVPHWFFADWAKTFAGGQPIREKDGNSAFQDLMYLLTLDATAKMEDAFGIPAMGDHYRQIAAKVRERFIPNYWVESKGLFADTYDRHSYSQHVNSLAVLAGVVTGPQATEVMKRTLSDPSIVQATIYFRYYVNMAMRQAGLGDELLDHMQVWKDQLALGLTTWAEMPEPTRSDCHAWGASPNIEFFRTVLGIDSDAPGFVKVRIAPSLGTLKEVSGSMPHPRGTVVAAYRVDAKKGLLTAELQLPDNTPGVFVWKGKEYPLKAGKNKLELTVK